MKLDQTYLIADRPIPITDPKTIRFTEFQRHSYVAGPGRRCVLWVAGCHRRCPGCFQSHFFDFQAGRSSPIDELTRQILSIEGIDGVTISGGEPFEQSKPLAELCRQIREQSDLSILAYTGYTIAALQSRSAEDRDLLKQLDLLIDGEYRESLSGPYLWRGSANQKLHNLGDATEVSSSVDVVDGEEESIQLVLEDNILVVGGFPASDMEDRLRQSLTKRGIILARVKATKSIE